MKTQPTGREKILANFMSDMRLISKIFKNSTIQQQKTNNPIKTWAKEINRSFPKKTYKWPTGT